MSWEEFGVALEELKQKIETSGKKHKYKYVYGIPRGGAAIALYLSHQLGLIYSTKIETHMDASEILIVDDISDTGETLTGFLTSNTATIYTTPWTEVTPTYSVVTKMNKDTWIIFPWEVYETEEGYDDTTKT